VKKSLGANLIAVKIKRLDNNPRFFSDSTILAELEVKVSASNEQATHKEKQ
jgi:hypothetical protein